MDFEASRKRETGRENQSAFWVAWGTGWVYLLDCLKGASPERRQSNPSGADNRATGPSGKGSNPDHDRQPLRRATEVSRRSPAFERPSGSDRKVAAQPEGASVPEGAHVRASAGTGADSETGPASVGDGIGSPRMESGNWRDPDRSELRHTSAETPRGRDFGRASSGLFASWAARSWSSVVSSSGCARSAGPVHRVRPTRGCLRDARRGSHR